MTLEEHIANGIDPWRLDLISAYSSAIARHASYLEKRFPGHDVEPMAFQALYLAAMTYRPGKFKFLKWLNWKISGTTANFRRTNRRREAAGISVGWFCPVKHGDRFYYWDYSEDDW